jgi:proline iminopeptidase
LAVDALHTLYWEECGNPQGVPVLFLHGGPGAGLSKAHRQFFDPAFYRIVLFDQRGAGQSTPLGEVRDNTTPHLVADIERLRELMGIERWLVFGGSWGSTLALAYGQAHPQRCTGFVLRGIFLCTPPELDWFLNGMRWFFPEAHAQLVAPIPPEERGDLLGAWSAGVPRLLLGVVLASFWAAPALLVVMAASTWLKRWGLPALGAFFGLGAAGAPRRERVWTWRDRCP